MSLLSKENGWALLAGLSCVAGFAPFGIFPIPVAALAVLFAYGVVLIRRARPHIWVSPLAWACLLPA